MANQAMQRNNADGSKPTDGPKTEAERSGLPTPTAMDDNFSVKLYPGAPSLPRFGYGLFVGNPSTFAPANDIPVPANYVVGPGDSIEVLVIGNLGGKYSLQVTRDGDVNVPQIGPVSVAGMEFSEVKSLLEGRIATQMSGTRASVTLGALRSIRVFVLGEARVPGAYTVSGISTISNALMASGGITTVGSLRNIELKRAGRVVATFDLYDLLVKGDTSKDLRLLPGDVLFIPPVGPVAGISGGVKRPGVYELKPGNAEVKDLIELAGGYDVNVDRTKGSIVRISDGPNRETLDLDLTRAADQRFTLRNGDFISVDFILPVVEGQVELLGHVHRPGKQAWKPGLRLADLISTTRDMRPTPDLGFVFIARLNLANGGVTPLSFDLRAAWKAPNSDANPELAPDDVIVAFESDKPRDRTVQCLMRPPVLRVRGVTDLQSCISSPPAIVGDAVSVYPIVYVGGSVRSGGTYPYETGMRVSDLLRAGGGISDRAYTLQAELIRYNIDAAQVRRREILLVDLQKMLAGDATADSVIEPFDELLVRVVPEWSTRNTVTLEGEVVFPGTYPIAPGETLRGVIERAGGLKATAYPAGAFFSRSLLRQREIEQLRKFESELRRDLAAQQREVIAKSEEGGADAKKLQLVLQSSLETANDNPALGRLTIDLDRILSSTLYSREDLLLQDGDRLFIPKRSAEVSVLGEVFQASSHVYEPGRSLKEYIDFAGGVRATGDEKLTYIVSASGRARRATSSFLRGGNTPIKPGDAIIVPIKVPKVRDPLIETLSQASQIIYNLSLGAAALQAIRTP